LPEEGSLVNHPQRYREYIAQKNQFKPGWGKIVKTYVDKLKSAKDMNRPGFIEMCKAIQQGEINAIICTELSRISRSVKDFVQFWEFLKKHNVKLILVNSFIDTSDFMGEYWLYQEINNAEMERKRTIHRIRNGHFSRANRGLTSGGIRILGYDPDPHRSCHLVVNKKEEPVVRFIFDKYLELGTVSKVVNYLNENGYKSKSYITKKTGRKMGGKPWNISSVHTLLTNLTYIGLREINKRKRHLDQSKLSETEKHSVVKAQWPAIVDEEIFLQTQKLIQMNKKIHRPSIHNYILTGLLFCDECGVRMKGRADNGKGGRYHYYTHPPKKTEIAKKMNKRCKLYTVPAPKIEEKILGRIKQIANNKKLLVKVIEKSSQSDSKGSKQLSSLIATRYNEIKEKKKEIDNLLFIISKNKTYDKPLLKKIEQLDDQIVKMEEEVKSLEEKRKESNAKKININEAADFFKNFDLNLKQLTKHLQKEAIRSVVKKVILSDNQITADFFCGYQKFLNNPNLLEKFNNLKDNKKDMFNNLLQQNNISSTATIGCSPALVRTPPTAHVCKICPHHCQ